MIPGNTVAQKTSHSSVRGLGEQPDMGSTGDALPEDVSGFENFWRLLP